MPAFAHRDSTLALARVVWTRRKWHIVLAFGASFLAAASLTLALPDLYRATVTVLVAQEAPEAGDRAAAGDEIEPRLQAVTQEVLSRTRLQALIDRFDLYPKLRKTAAPEDVIERMRRDIRLERKEVEQRWGRGGTVSFTLSYQAWDPRTAAEVANRLASFYVDRNEEIRGRQAAGSQAAGAADQIAPLKRELAGMRARYSDRYPDVIKLQSEIAALERQRLQKDRAGPAASAPPGGDQFRILDPAIVPREPFAPNRLRLLVMGLVLSLGAAAFAVILAEQLDTSFHRVDELREFTDVPVLASIVRIDTAGDLWRQRLRRAGATLVSGVALAFIVRAFYALGQGGERLVWILAQPGGGG